MLSQEEGLYQTTPAGGALGEVALNARITAVVRGNRLRRDLGRDRRRGSVRTSGHGDDRFFLLLMLPGGGDELQGIKKAFLNWQCRSR